VSLLDVVVPPACGGCGRMGALLCDRCISELRAASRPDHRFIAADPGVIVGASFRLAICAFVYEGALRRALGALKYAGVARVAVPLANAAVPALRQLLVESGRAPLVPVPVHDARRRERGYNQAGLLAVALGTAVDLPVHDLLERRRATTKQHLLDRSGRLRNLAGAFAVRRGARAPPVAIVVDDIATTSATLESCAAALRGAGAEAIYGFTIARER
jgi:ComF family protein